MSPEPNGRIHNFSAGPAVLPEKVLRQAAADIWNIRNSGIGILEHSHRGPTFQEVLDQAIEDCRQLAGIGEEYEILFLQGGASTQFFMLPMSYLTAERGADYIDTGSWSRKAIAEAERFGPVNVSFDGRATSYDHLPTAAEISSSPDPVYVHYTSNNTIYGTQFRLPPETDHPLVVDASSDIFSHSFPFSRHAVVYAGAQKNLGPAGVTLVIIRRDFVEMGNADLPTMLRYETHARKQSCYNTPPVFGVYVMGQVFKWILDQGGLPEMQSRNEAKAKLIYDAIDGSRGFYRPVARSDSRSHMNVCFRTPSEELDAAFVKEAKASGLSGLKGHRSVGGLRASIYNACPRAACEALAALMVEFERKSG